MAAVVVVGRIGRAHGIRGDVSVDVRTDEPELRFADGAVLTTEASAFPTLTVRDSRWHSGRLLVTFDGIDDRTAAEALQGIVLHAQVGDERPADPAEYYDRQLVGLTARHLAGHDLGTITEVTHLPAQDLLVITTPDGAELLVPFVTEIVPEVDLGAGFLIVDPPPGLLEELPEQDTDADASAAPAVDVRD